MQYLPKKLYSDGGDYLAYTYRKPLILRDQDIYTFVFFVVRGISACQLKQGHQKPLKPVDKMHYSVLIYTYVDTRKESAKDESREKI